jgi:hypothetical protein
MPHMFVSRPRLYDLTKGNKDLKRQFRWETINAVIYKVGGFLFIIGSIFFFPKFEAYGDIGALIFLVGSLFYLVVTGHDLAEVRHYWATNTEHERRAWLEYSAAASYFWGTILFTVGSIFFFSAVGWIRAGAWCFVVGSLLFVLGATVNVLQIVSAQKMMVLQLMNFTAITFIVGAVLFTVASVPYLWDVAASVDRVTLYTFLAWQFLAGSVLFFAGGVFNYLRAYVIMRGTLSNPSAGNDTHP